MKQNALTVAIDDGELVIRIGLGALRTAIELNPSYPYGVNVTDMDTIAKEIVGELSREEEDGSTPVHRMLDAAFAEAMEQGAEGAEINEGGGS